ncbi:HAD family hydrolase [Caproiciproducens galactitolivorans]|uniref:Phosphoglycolate phosphatase n=1 Tax=Caproiciproducens galactitolivorans TaxID=642589 RepID=A0A4Z0Y920_9FIRM|nr:HAD family hydrolase [Caproiciproducens galactitolivorans]TGJ75450.1 phosphoglycolate phosphatase [Caproiciproducens galactitolivorans]
MKRLAIFDVDGTLNQTELYAVKAYRKTLLDLGRPDVSDAEIIALIGLSPQEIEKRLLDGCSPEICRAYSRQIVRNESDLMKKYGKAFDGTAKMLQDLRNLGILTAVCSNATQAHIEDVLDAIHLTGLIDLIQPLEGNGTKADSLCRLLEKVRPDAACMVGDRRFDSDAARQNGIPFVGCLYGYGRAEVAGADFTANSPHDVLRCVLQLLVSGFHQE